jgi:hypothetical protein
MPSRKEPSGSVVYRVSAPPDERNLVDDTPEEYIVMEDDCCCCLIYGRYGGLWHCNVSARWLVRHLIENRPGATATSVEVGRAR